MILNNYALTEAIVRRQLVERGWKLRPSNGTGAFIQVMTEFANREKLEADLKTIRSPLRLDVENDLSRSTIHILQHPRTLWDHAHGRLQAGRLIAIEGVDGAGKTTAALNLEAVLYERFGVMARVTDAISDRATSLGGAIGGALRVKRDRSNPTWEAPSSQGEQAAILAARVDQWHSVILPALCRGVWVITDRHDLSARAYRRDEQEENPLDAMEKHYGICWADVTFVLDIERDSPRWRKSLRPERNRLEDRTDMAWDWIITNFRRMAKERHSTYLIDADSTERATLEVMCERMIHAGWLPRKEL